MAMDITGVISRSAGNTLDTQTKLPNAQNQLEFADIMGKRTTDGYQKHDETKIRETVENFVAETFVRPIFKQLRSTNQAQAPFAPSKAEQQFQSLIDAQLARRMVHKANWPLVDRLAQDMLVNAGLRPSPWELAGQEKPANADTQSKPDSKQSTKPGFKQGF